MKTLNIKYKWLKSSPLWNLFFTLLAVVVTASCKKESTVSSETISLLQNKWTLISSSVAFPANTSLNSRYRGLDTDYYLFGTDDTLRIDQAGQVTFLLFPLSLTTKYTFIDGNTIGYGPNPSFPVNIVTLTTKLLVLSNSASASFVNADNSVTSYEGTKIDSLRR